MSSETLYQERFARIQKAIHLEPLDCVPVIFMGTAFAPHYMGMSMAEFCADPEAAFQVSLAAMDRLNGFGGLDGATFSGGGSITPSLTALWLSRLEVPGRDLPPDSLWQVREAEVMTVEDYDAILEKGWHPFLKSYLPRVIDATEFQQAMDWEAANAVRIREQYKDHGYVIVCDAPVMPNLPFEALCGGRSMTKFFLDLHRIPDKVEAVMQVILDETLAQIEAAQPVSGIGGSRVGGWRSASALLAPKLWNRFVWPYMVKYVDALVAKGFTPLLHLDQDWTRDLGRLCELPARKCILNPDGMTNMRKFRETVSDRMAMQGDVPSSLLATGTPDDVRNYVRDLVQLFEGRGLLLCPGCDAPINAKPENMEALVAAGHEFGRVAA